jgi:histidinol-phosphate/aromatic aminotransferase/cobyric acid decarboxylase-like protein
VLFNSPHNPSGRVFTEEELSLIRDLCVEHDVVAITDEIYEHLVFDGRRHIPIATLPDMQDRTITICGLGKTFAVTGWRVGYCIANPELTDALRKVLTYGKVRASWAKVGNDAKPYQLSSVLVPRVPFGGKVGFSIPDELPNSGLRPEKTISRDKPWSGRR